MKRNGELRECGCRNRSWGCKCHGLRMVEGIKNGIVHNVALRRPFKDDSVKVGGQACPLGDEFSYKPIGIMFDESLHHILVIRFIYECLDTWREAGLINKLFLLMSRILIVAYTSIEHSEVLDYHFCLLSMSQDHAQVTLEVNIDTRF